MKVGSRADYGLRALIYLASLDNRDAPQQISVIARRQQIPEDYLRQLLVQLRAAGVVRSVRGPHGGYLLARDPADVSVAAVVEALEGEPERMKCSHLECDAPRCALIAGCELRALWGEAVDAMQEVLRRRSLADLLASAPEPRPAAQ